MTYVLGSETYPTFLDIEEQVKPWLQFSGIDLSHDEILNLIVDGICAEAARLTGGPIAATQYGPDDGLGKFDGDGGLYSGYIMLPRRPVVEIVSVVEWQGSNPVTLTEIDPSSGGDGYQINYRSGRMTRVLGGVWNRPFFPGSNNVWITLSAAGLRSMPTL